MLLFIGGYNNYYPDYGKPIIDNEGRDEPSCGKGSKPSIPPMDTEAMYNGWDLNSSKGPLGNNYP